QVEFTQLDVEKRLPSLFVVNYWINRTSENISALYANYHFTEDVYNLSGTTNLKIKYTDKFIDYITLDLDYCKALQMLHGQYVSRIIASGIRSVSNYPLDCPLKKNIEYYLKGFTVNTDIIPSYFPEISFAINCTFLTNQRPIISINVIGQIRR
ncbi:hypothetical protein KR044_010535, partial [Drosophila immigrans]